MNHTHSKKRLGAAIALALVTTTALAACSTPSTTESGSTDGPITLGAAVGLSGFFTSYDGPSMDMLRMWVDDVNADGGIDGREVKLVEADTKSDPAQGAVAAQEVISQGADIVIVSCDFDYGSPAATAAIAEGKLAFSLCAGSPLFGPPALGDLAFSMGGNVADEAVAAANWAYTEQGWRSLYMLKDDGTQYLTGYSEAFTTAWEDLGGTFSGVSTMQSTDTAFDDQVAKIAASDSDAVVTDLQEAGGPSAIRAIRAAGIDLPLIGNVALESNAWLDTVPGLVDFYFTRTASISGDDPRDEVNTLQAAYVEEYGHEPAWSYAFLGYAMGETLKAAIEETGGDLSGAALSAALVKNPSATALGTVTFTSEIHLDQTRLLQVAEFDDGTAKFVATIDPTTFQ